MGNTCYLASVLQALAATPTVVEFFLRERHERGACGVASCAACALDGYIVDAYAEGEDALVASELLYAWWENEQSMADEQQHDAHECFLSLVSVAHANLLGKSLRRKKPKPVGLVALLSLEPLDEDDEHSSAPDVDSCECIFHQSFAGVLQSEFACASCGCVTSTIREATVGISVDVPSGASKSAILEDCLRDFTAREMVESSSHRAACASCASSNLSKRMCFERVPKMLNLHLKRFEGGFESASMRKNDIHVEFPFQLDVSPYTANGAAVASFYDLYAVVVHSGVLEGGHYTAYIRRAGAWYLCDDAVILEVNEEEVRSAQAFMLFYEET